MLARGMWSCLEMASEWLTELGMNDLLMMAGVGMQQQQEQATETVQEQATKVFG